MNRHFKYGAIVLVAGALLAVGYGSVAWFSQGTDKQTQPTYDDYLRANGRSRPGGGVQPRQVDPATEGMRPAPEGGWLLGDHSEAVQTAKVAADLDELFRDDSEKWAATQEWKLSHGGTTPYGLARRRCMLERASGRLGGQACKNDVVVVIHRTAADTGKVVYVQPKLSDDANEGCRDYSDCLMREGWMGREAPLPPGDEPYFAFRAGDVLIPFQGSEEERLVLVRKETDRLRQQIEELAASEDPRQIDLLRDLLAFNEWILEEADG